MTDIKNQIINRINTNDELLTEGILRNVVIYGPINTFKIWLEKWFAGSKVIGLFNDIKFALYDIIAELDKFNVRFSEKYINKVEFDNLLNDAIYNCIYNKTKQAKGSDPGKCIINYFLTVNINILMQVLKETTILMQDEGLNISKIRNIKDFQDLTVDESSKLHNLKIRIDNYINKLINFLTSKQFNKYLTVSKIKKTILDADFKINKFKEIDDRLMGVININDVNIKKIRSFSI